MPRAPALDRFNETKKRREISCQVLGNCASRCDLLNNHPRLHNDMIAKALDQESSVACISYPRACPMFACHCSQSRYAGWDAA